MNSYDVLIVGASTTGSWTAQRMAENGLSVLVIEKQKRESISKDYDIFHMGRKEMEKFGLPIPKEDDCDYAFEYTGGATYSPYGNYPKPGNNNVIGMHKHDYILRLNDNAVKAGATLVYGASFEGFIFDENQKIVGARYMTDEGEKEAFASIVVDCSGIPSVARRALPDGYGVESFEISPRDLFYVTLRYIIYEDGIGAPFTDSYIQYKVWSAPQADKKGAILGVGANLSFDYGEEMFREFKKNVPWKKYTVEHIERGRTPYRRPPYSFVADGFIAMGDAACLTKPNNGEGCTSSLYQAKIAVDVISRVIKGGKKPTRENLWSINKRYVNVQGKSFASTLATLIGAAAINNEEGEYFFKHDIVFSAKTFAGISGGISFTPAELASMAYYIAKGVAKGTVRVETLKRVIGAAKTGSEIKALYECFPDSPESFDAWVKKADEMWQSVGSMADNCDPVLIERMNKRAKENTDKAVSSAQ